MLFYTHYIKHVYLVPASTALINKYLPICGPYLSMNQTCGVIYSYYFVGCSLLTKQFLISWSISISTTNQYIIYTSNIKHYILMVFTVTTIVWLRGLTYQDQPLLADGGIPETHQVTNSWKPISIRRPQLTSWLNSQLGSNYDQLNQPVTWYSQTSTVTGEVYWLGLYINSPV